MIRADVRSVINVVFVMYHAVKRVTIMALIIGNHAHLFVKGEWYLHPVGLETRGIG